MVGLVARLVTLAGLSCGDLVSKNVNTLSYPAVSVVKYAHDDSHDDWHDDAQDGSRDDAHDDEA